MEPQGEYLIEERYWDRARLLVEQLLVHKKHMKKKLNKKINPS